MMRMYHHAPVARSRPPVGGEALTVTGVPPSVSTSGVLPIPHDAAWFQPMSGATDPGVDAAGARGDEVGRGDGADRDPDGGEVRVGTASWTDPTMTAGVFYPRGAGQPRSASSTTPRHSPGRGGRHLLRAAVAATASCGSTARRPTSSFDIKAHALMTGQGTETKRLPKAIRERAARAGREQDADLRQGPAGRAARRGLARSSGTGSSRSPRPASSVDPAPVPALVLPIVGEPRRDRDRRSSGRRLGAAVEFRNGSWFNEKNAERTLRFLAIARSPFVMVDEPQGFKSSVPPIVAVTSPELAVVRFHGRNRDLGGQGHHPGRALPLPLRREELAEWAPPIRHDAARGARDARPDEQLLRQLRDDNARELAALLSGELPD